MLNMRAMEEHLSGGDPNWLGLERILRRIIIEEVIDDDDDDAEEIQDPIIFDHKRLKPENSMHYKVLDQGKETWMSRYQLKKKYPDTFASMIQAYKERNVDDAKQDVEEKEEVEEEEDQTITADGSKEDKVVHEEYVPPKAVAKMQGKEEDIPQVSTMVGSTDERKAVVDLAVKAQQVEGHGEGGGIPDEVRDVGQHEASKKPFRDSDKECEYVMEKVEEVLPTPSTQKIYSQMLEPTIPNQGGHAGMKKRLSEPTVHHKNSPGFELGRGKRISSSKHGGLPDPKSAPPPKRTRFSLGDHAYAGGPERPYISSSRTDTASVAMELLSKVISNEKMLCEALEEEQERNQYLEELLREKGSDREEEDERIMYKVDQMVASQLQKTTASLDEYRSKYETEKEKLSKSQEENSLQASEIVALKNKLTSTQAEREKELVESEKRAERIEELVSSTQKLEARLEKEQECNQKHSAELEEKSQEIKNLVSDSNDLKTTLKKQEAINKKNSAELEKKSIEIESLKSQIKKMEETIEQNTKESKERSYGIRSTLAQLKSIFAADAVESKKLTQQLWRAVKIQGGDLPTVVEFIMALKMGADDAMKQYRITLNGTEEQIKSLKAQVERFKKIEKERQEKGDQAVQKALEMQAQAREFLCMIKSGKRYTYEETHVSENDDDEELAGVTDPEERKRLSMLKPYYWRDQNDPRMKPRIHIATTKNNKVILTVIFPEKECTYYYDSEELHSKQNCLLPLVKFYESRVTKRKEKK